MLSHNMSLHRATNCNTVLPLFCSLCATAEALTWLPISSRHPAVCSRLNCCTNNLQHLFVKNRSVLLCRGQGEALNIDRRDMYARLYACIPELAMLHLQPDDGSLDHLLSQGKPCLDHLMSIDKLTLSDQLNVSLKLLLELVMYCIALHQPLHAGHCRCAS